VREPTLAEAMAASYDLMTGRGRESDRGYRLTATSEIAPERVSWLWTGRVPAGTVTVIDGDPGKGKSTLTAALAAAVSTGTPLPGDENSGRGIKPSDPGGVIFVSLEDDPAMVIVPRLIAAGADLTRIHIPVMFEFGGDRLARLPDDLVNIQQMIYETDARLVIIDPLMAALSADVNGNQDQDVRRVLAELARIAGTTGAAVVLVRHLNKSAGRSAIYRGGGSIGIIGAARSGLLLTTHPAEPEQLLLTVSKSNLGVRPKALALRIVQAENGFGAVSWGEETEISADDALNGLSQADEQDRSAAEDWLLEALRECPQPARAVLADAEEHGFTEKMIRTARRNLGVITTKAGAFGESQWIWRLPERAKPEAAPKAPVAKPGASWAPSDEAGAFADSHIYRSSPEHGASSGLEAAGQRDGSGAAEGALPTCEGALSAPEDAQGAQADRDGGDWASSLATAGATAGPGDHAGPLAPVGRAGRGNPAVRTGGGRAARPHETESRARYGGWPVT
jgi:hypothetical protein